MKSSLCFYPALLSVLVAFSLTPARAQSGSTVALAAGAAAIAAPVLVQAVSRSHVGVEVEVYRETYPLPFGVTADSTNSPDRLRTAPFQLDGSPALARLLAGTQTNDPAIDPTDTGIGIVAAQLGQMLDQIKSAAGGPRRLADKLDKTNPQANSVPDLVRQEFHGITDDMTNLQGQVETFVREVGDGLTKGGLTPDQLHTFANQIQGIRLRTVTMRKDYSPGTTDLLKGWLGNLFGDAVPTSTNAAGETVTSAVTLNAPFGAVTPPTGEMQTGHSTLSHTVWEAVGRLKDLDASKGRVKADSGGWIQLSTDKINELNKNVDQWFVQYLGYPSLAAAKNCKTEADFNQLILRSPSSVEYQIAQMTEVSSKVNSATFAGLTVSVNMGPIANEVMQGVFAKSRMIDEITSHSDRWTRFNYVDSWGGAGNQNVVVYFEDALTPVLKSATFDPSQFLTANAQIYKRAMTVLGDVYGVPVAGGTASSSPTASLNLSSTKARKTAADNATTQARQQMIAALKSLLDLHDTLAKSATGAAGARTWTGTNGLPSLQDAVAKLQAISLQLENPKPTQP